MTEAIDRTTEQWIGMLFLVGMVVTLILAIWTFDGTPTVILLITSLVFLVVARFFLARDEPSPASTAPAHGAASGAGSSDPAGRRIYEVCPECRERVPEAHAYCHACGAEMEG